MASSVTPTKRFLSGMDLASFSSFPPRASVMMSLHNGSAHFYVAEVFIIWSASSRMKERREGTRERESRSD